MNRPKLDYRAKLITWRMSPRSNFLLILLCFAYVVCPAQTGILQDKPAGDTATVDRLLQQSKDNFDVAPDKTIAFATSANDMAQKIKYYKGQAMALKNIGIGYYNQGKYIEAISFWDLSRKRFELNRDDVGVANILNNVGAVYFNQGDDPKALEYYLKSLKLAEQTGDKLRILSAMNNVGGVYFNNPATFDKALYYFLKALNLSEELKDKENLGTIAGNVGEIYAAQGKDSLALVYYNLSLRALRGSGISATTYNNIGRLYTSEGQYETAITNHRKAYEIAGKVNGQLDMVQALMGLGEAEVKRDDDEAALKYFAAAEGRGKEINALYQLKDIYRGMSDIYKANGNYQQAYQYERSFAAIKDSLYNVEKDKKLGTLQFDFDLQKKQGEIDLLTKDKALQELELNKEKMTRNMLLGGLVLVFIIAFIIYRYYREKVKVNRILDQQKEKIESLLLNILPAEVAKELQLNGKAKSKNYESVTVLFADFIGFTSIADKLTPEELIRELNSHFMAFDNIVEKYGIEKIKTIGDSYMCAGGLPIISEKHAFHVVKASLEIQEYVLHRNLEREAQNLEPWNLRIGIHVGPVIAGVIGTKKYAYDIWGNTVNIASRMESNGAAGRVNISADTYLLIKDRFACSYRGKIYAKNMGEIDMYFVDHEIVETEKKLANGLQLTNTLKQEQ